MFIINASLLLLSIIYSVWRLKIRTTDTQRPLSEAKNVFIDYFDYNHVIQTFRTLFKKRPLNRRTYLLLFIVSMAFYTFQREEKSLAYLYFQLVLNWTFDTISYFRTYQSALQGVFLFVIVPFLNKILGWRDTWVIMVGSLCHSIARVFFATARSTVLIYVGK